MRFVDRVGRAAHAQAIAVDAQRNGHEAFERGQVAIEVPAERQRVAQTRQFEDPLRLRLSQGNRSASVG